MNSLSLPLEDVFFGTTTKCPVIAQVDEVLFLSPSEEHTEIRMCGGGPDLIEGCEQAMDHCVGSVQSESFEPRRTNSSDFLAPRRNGCDPVQRSKSFDSLQDEESRMKGSLSERKPKMKLPSFSSMGIASSNSLLPVDAAQAREVLPHSQIQNTVFPTLAGLRGRPPSHSWPPHQLPAATPLLNGAHGVVPLLTPPEDADCFQWNTKTHPGISQTIHSASSGQNTTTTEGADQQRTQMSTTRPTEISLPAYINMSGQGGNSATWLDRAIEIIVTNTSEHTGSAQIQVVVQALPSQPKTANMRPVFEEVVEGIQQRSTNVPYVTITHAVSQAFSMEEVPASPPATPNILHSRDEYFDNQTIFTHAAVVPNYHAQTPSIATTLPRPNSIIAAPSSINVCTLERYIPPTTSQELRDFFSISRRSYLVDRLTELSAVNGTLLLVYPTQRGGRTFAKSYLGPVIDPFLRRFVMLNNLTTDAAAALGKTESVPKMLEFEQMKTRLAAMCQELTQRAPNRGMQSNYNVVHAETAEVTLERGTWVEWFLEQEMGRIRQNLVNYQKSGGRMPKGEVNASPGMLARVVIDGIRASTEAAGGVGIEVGVFVIRRSIV